MKTIRWMATALLLLCSVMLIGATSFSNSYDVAGVYKEVRDGDEYYAKLDGGSSGAVDKLYEPIRNQAGTYDVTVTRVNNNFYRIDGTNTYIQTRYCYEYSYGDRAELTISGWGGSVKGHIVFE